MIGRCLAISAVVVVAACGENNGPGGGSARHLVLLGDSVFDALPGDTVGPVKVRVVDSQGNPAAGEQITWSADGGGTPALATAVSDANGIAYTGWLLGFETGRQRLSASPAQGEASVVATADVVGWQVSMVSSGRGGHLCAIEQDGTAFCFGGNSAGQLGDGSTTDSPTPVPVESAVHFTSIVTGSFHTCGLAATGLAYCWGANTYGQLGDGTQVMRLVPTPVKMPTGLAFRALVAGSESTCGLSLADEAWCWGNNRSGMLGNGSIDPALLPGVVSGGIAWRTLAINDQSACGLDLEGRTYCWGTTYLTPLQGGAAEYHSPILVTSAPPLDTLVTSDYNQCGLAQGTLYCFPYFYGVGEVDWSLDGVTSLTAGYKPYFALTINGTAYYFGAVPNSSYGWGDPPVALLDHILLKSLGNNDFVACGIDTPTSTLICWGPHLPPLPGSAKPYAVPRPASSD